MLIKQSMLVTEDKNLGFEIYKSKLFYRFAIFISQ